MARVAPRRLQPVVFEDVVNRAVCLEAREEPGEHHAARHVAGAMGLP